MADHSRRVLLVGEPGLGVVCDDVASHEFLTHTDPSEWTPAQRYFSLEVQALHATLKRFQAEHGFGRGIAACQIDVRKRFIALSLDGESYTMVNPEIVDRSEETITLWDDCMSFPWLLCLVRRNKSISVKFQNEFGEPQSWENLDVGKSELLQHEIDHLNGVLALDRANEEREAAKRSRTSPALSNSSTSVDSNASSVSGDEFALVFQCAKALFADDEKRRQFEKMVTYVPRKQQ